jgi:alpha-N-arabinofuranosidase
MTKDVIDLTVESQGNGTVISPLLFGHNLEHTRKCIWQGLSAQQLRNRKFCFEPCNGGVSYDWYRIGTDECIWRLLPSLEAYTSHVGVDLTQWGGALDWSTQYQQIECAIEGTPCGIGQDAIHLQKGLEYETRFAFRGDRQLSVQVRLCNDNRRKDYFVGQAVVKPGDWQEFKFVFKAPRTDPNARLEITFAQEGTLHIGVTALTRTDTFLGMRRDVIQRLKDISVPMLRWPGGNYAGDYRWKDGILPVDRRGALKSPGEYTQRYTHNYDNHEIGTDEYIALCRELGAEPSITINISFEGPDEAAQWVEYCNGSPDTKWGKARADRGHVEPYNVKYWSLGNEAGYGHMKGPNRTSDYYEMASKCAQAMRKVDPSLIFVASGLWSQDWIKQTPPEAYESFEHISYHRYIIPAVNRFLGPEGEKELRRAAFMPVEDFELVRQTREELQKHVPAGRAMGISYDEWNMWYSWNNVPVVVDGIYAAGFINRLCREAKNLGISLCAYFEPVNEGCIVVEPTTSHLTPMGHTFTLLKAHKGNRLLKVAGPEGEGDLDATASLSPSGKRMFVSVVNRNHRDARDMKLTLAGGKTPKSVKVTSLEPNRDKEPSALFVKKTSKLSVSGDSIALTVPRFSVVMLEVTL